MNAYHRQGWGGDKVRVGTRLGEGKEQLAGGDNNSVAAAAVVVSGAQ